MFDYLSSMINALKKDKGSIEELVEEDKNSSYGSTATPEQVLGISNLPPYDSVIHNSKQLIEISCILYECKKTNISKVSLDKKFEYPDVKKVNLKFKDGTKSCFYIKNSWEGAMKEALGMALTNLLLKRYFRFVVDKNTETIVVDEIKGKRFKDISEIVFTRDSSRNYGVALEFANALGLADRHGSNIILTEDNNIVNIDFGMIFLCDYSHRTELSHKSPVDKKALKEGRIHGRKIMQENLKRNKSLLEEIIVLAKKEVSCNPIQAINSYLSSPI